MDVSSSTLPKANERKRKKRNKGGDNENSSSFEQSNWDFGATVQGRRRALSCFPVAIDDLHIDSGSGSMNLWSHCTMDTLYGIDVHDNNIVLCRLVLELGMQDNEGEFIPARKMFEIYADEVRAVFHTFLHAWCDLLT